MENNNEIETLDIDIDDLFKDPEESSPAEEQGKEPEKKNEEMTKAVSERINTVKKKTESETEDRIAKELGFESYADMKKANEKKLLKDAGYDENDEQLSAIVEKLVEQRLSNDPRMKKLEEYEEDNKAKFVKAQLKEINDATGNKFTSLDDLSKETLDLWGKIGNLKQAYFATEGANLLTKQKAANNNGSLAHMADSNQSGSGSRMRPLNDEERAIYRLVNPDITDEELNKITTEIK